MASKNPVPSRAALNALRGVLFTTSCSVILLAEERRRRLEIARAAIENARKLHTVRSNRGPIALSEGVGAWEERLSDLGDEVLSTVPRPRGSYRRRRRDALSNVLLHDGEHEIHRHYLEQPETSSRGDLADAELKASHETGSLGLSLDATRLIPPTSGSRPHGVALTPRARFAASAPSGHLRTTRRHIVGRDSSIMDEFQQAPVDTTVAQDHTTKPPYHDTLMTLKQLLGDLATGGRSRSAASETLDLAIASLRQLGSLHPPTPKLVNLLRSNGIKLLRSTVDLDNTKTTDVLDVLLPKCKDPLQGLLPLVRWLREKEDRKGLEQLLEFLSIRKQARFWIRGTLIYRLLFHQNKLRESFEETKHLYRMLQDAGLFDEIVVPRDVEYKVRQYMVMIALKAGDDAFARKEIQMLSKLEPDATKLDVKLQSRLVVREAALRHWDSVRAGIEILTGIADTRCKDFQTMLGKITDIFAQTYSPEELEALLRRFVCDYKIPLKLRWVNVVMDRHASRHQLDSMFSWLQFCSDHGLQMDDGFIQSFYSRCRKYWSFSDKSIAKLHESLQTSLPISKSSVDESSGKEGFDNPPAELELGSWASESDAYSYMESLATQSEWERICEAYGRFSLSDLGFSARCLHLAVLGHIKMQDGCVDRATSLVNEAWVKGHDVTEALTPLLLARLEKGDDASDLIKEGLRRGARIHDSVYNKAAQALSAKGDLRGAAAMCEVAARENGNGELLYSEYNFANLVFAHTGSARYGALQSVLSTFTSEVQWWRGSRTCKEGIKLAMKTVAMRAAVSPEDEKQHREALFKLDEALTHVKRCRSTRDDRRAVTEAFIRLVRPREKADGREELSPDETSKAVVEVERQSAEQVEPARLFRKQTPVASQSQSQGVVVVRHGLAAAGEA